MPDAFVTVDYVEHGRRHARFQHLRVTTRSFDEVLERLRQAIVAADLMVLHEIDPQAILARKGYGIGRARQLLFFHPRLMARLLAADPSALLEAPLKFSVIEGTGIEGAGGRVSVRWQDPMESFFRYGHEDLSYLGTELDTLCTEIADAALGRD